MQHSKSRPRVSTFGRAVLMLSVTPCLIGGGRAWADTGAPSEAQGLDEVVVTASKRPEELRDVANSVTAFTSAELESLGAQSFQDYLGRAPGVIFQASTPGVANVTIRGIGTATVYPDQGQATTGIYLDDIPLTDPGFAISVPDLDVFDMQRVEVLRGPQGTLFGTATLGGAVNYITNPVALDAFDALAQVSGYRTHNSSETGFTVKGAANVPLVNDKFGVRLTAIKRSDPGYLDNIGFGGRDTNQHDVEAARLNALWQIAPGIKLNLYSFYDRAHSGDGFYAYPAFGNLVRDTIIPEYATFVTRINGMRFDADLSFATLTVTSADSHKSQNSVADLTSFYGSPTTGPSYAHTHSDMGEIRLTSPGNQRIDWLVGVYYGWFDENYPTPTLQNNIDTYDFTVAYRSNETSVFGEATYHFSDAWRMAVGGREYHIGLRTDVTQGVPGEIPDENLGWQKGSGFSPKASLTYEPSKLLMTYALVSKGFRMGGVNLNQPEPGFPTPLTYGSDHLINYEIGLRLSNADHTLQFDTTPFYINWTNIQLRLNRPDGRAYVANAGAAHSKGLENTLLWRPMPALALQANVTYLDADLAKTLALGNGTILPEGARLPGASRWSTSESISYAFAAPLHPHILLAHRFLSQAYSDFSTSLPIGNYHVFDVRAGVDIANVVLSAFANNVADRRGVTAAAMDGFGNLNDFYLTPRTVGLALDWHLR